MMVVFDPDKMRRLKLYRAAQSEPASTGGGAAKESEGLAKANGNNLRRNEPVVNNLREAAAQKIMGRRGGGSSGRSNGSGYEKDDTPVKGFDSPSRPAKGFESPSRPVKEFESPSRLLKGFESPSRTQLYRLPTPLHPALGQGVGDISQTDLVPVKSSPSDMNFSSDVSPRHSISSQESLARSLPSSAGGARRTLLAEGRRSTPKRSTETLELLSNSRHSGEGIDVGVNEPHFEITSFQGDDGVETTSSTASTSGIDWSQQAPSPTVPPGLSPGPPIHVREIEEVGSFRIQKKSSSRGSSNTSNEAAATSPAEKGNGGQATHPILDKLRKGWGSALRGKQRHEGDPALSDTRSDTSTERDSGEQQVQANGVSTRKKWDHAQAQSEALKRTEQADAALAVADQPPTEREILIRDIITRERRAALKQQRQQLLQQHPPQPLKFITDGGVLDSPPRSRVFHSNGSSVDHLPSSHKASSGSTAARSGLAKAQANYQRPTSDPPSKFKKQYQFAETGVSKSLSMQKNKANMLLEMDAPSPPTGQAWKRKPAVPTRRQLSPRSIGPALNSVRTVPQASARTNTVPTAAPPPAQARRSVSQATQTSPPAKRAVTIISNSGPLVTSTTKTGGLHSLDAGDAYGAKNKRGTPDRKAMTTSVNLRGSNGSSAMLTKQRSERLYSTTVKEAITNARSCRNGVQVADESVAIASEERKSKAAPKYEPRLHSARAIKEWEGKSGKRYYDLAPIERQKVNQELSAAAAASKAGLTKRTSA